MVNNFFYFNCLTLSEHHAPDDRATAAAGGIAQAIKRSAGKFRLGILNASTAVHRTHLTAAVSPASYLNHRPGIWNLR